MRLVILADEFLKEELLRDVKNEKIELVWVRDPEAFTPHRSADGFLDLLFENNPKRMEILTGLSPKPVIVNSVVTTLKELRAPFVRINAWPGFFGRSMLEASCNNQDTRRLADEFFALFNKTIGWVADEPGFVTLKVIAMIINEAYIALEENVSSKEEIDTAMKLGTSYPFGPFEWSKKIGVKNIFSLLHELHKTNSRYQPANLLAQEAML